MKFAELKAEASRLGLSTKGRKADLLARLEENGKPEQACYRISQANSDTMNAKADHPGT